MKVLFITSNQIFRMVGGQYIRSSAILKSLTEKHKVVVLSPEPHQQNSISDRIIHWYYIPDGTLFNCTNIRVFRSRFFIPRSLFNILSEIYRKHNPDITWYDYGHWGHYNRLAKKYNSKTVMGTHNSQSILTKNRMANAQSITEFIEQGINYISQNIHEKLFFPKFDKIVSVSKQDQLFHSKFVGKEKSFLLRNYLDNNSNYDKEIIHKKQKTIVVTGSFASFQNSIGIKWFLKKVWPDVFKWDRNIYLNIVGYKADKINAFIKDSTNINTISNVKDIVPYIKEATIAIVPIFHGSGTRIKILEALVCKTPIISTRLGSEGLDLIDNTHLLNADSSSDFVDAIKRLIKDRALQKTLANEGYKLFRSLYDYSKNTSKLNQILS